MDINDIVAWKIAKFRTKQNLTQMELADLAGLHRTYIGHIERAEKNIGVRNLQKIAIALSVDIKELLVK